MLGYENYDLNENDAYLIPNSTCLANKLSISETKKLNLAEAEFSKNATAYLIHMPIEPTYDLKHLCSIHKTLFDDVYDWAGQVRCTEIGKGDCLFLPHALILEESKKVFNQLHAEKLLSGLTIESFADRAGYYLGRINTIHSFREGNGRVQRIFMDQLANSYGFAFTWSAISGEQMALACREARTSDSEAAKLRRLLQLNCVTL